MSKSLAYRHQLRALARWPKDPLRPEVQFQDIIRRRIDRRLGITNSQEDQKTSDKNKANVQKQTIPWNEAAELEQANALYSLVEGRYSRKYPLTTLLNPASNPTHYKDLVKELEEAPSRSWFGRLTKSWKGFLRFQ